MVGHDGLGKKPGNQKALSPKGEGWAMMNLPGSV